MPSLQAFLTVAASLALTAFVAALAYLIIRYAPIIGRIFEEMPLFQPLRAAPGAGGEDVTFKTRDGLTLAGTYFKARTPDRAGVVVFCHEFLGDRWSAGAYADHLRDDGFDLFTFDFRNHGASESEPGYRPLQWVSNREVRDLRAALAYLRSRPDRDEAGFGLFGVSRGGSSALCVAAKDPRVWGVATDGAFPTRGTMSAYIGRWADIYVGDKPWRGLLGNWVFELVGWAGRVRSEWRLGCKFPDVERSVARIAPRPWFMIHGEKDAYIGTAIAEALFARAGEPKESWIVPKAKHNRSREVEPAKYRDRVSRFFRQTAPRQIPAAEAPPQSAIVADLSIAAVPTEPVAAAH